MRGKCLILLEKTNFTVNASSMQVIDLKGKAPVSDFKALPHTSA